MGARYYDPKAGRFLSPDPVGYPISMNLYTYAGGDPVNYLDPDGRFASHAYQTVKPIVIDTLQNFTLRDAAPIIHGINFCSSYIKEEYIRSRPYQTGSFDLPNGAIGFINGINNTPIESLRSSTSLSLMAQGADIYGIYNATHSAFVDALECAVGHAGIHTPPVQMLKDKWSHLISTNTPNAKFLEICHSGGADHLKNALETSSSSVRQRIIVLAIAPSVIIPKRLCFKSDNYVSRRDFVTHLDFFGKMRYGNQLHVLEPHPNAKFWDHEFLSPTFDGVKRFHVDEYLENYAGKK